MSLAAQLQDLQKEQRRELALVRSRLATLADSLEHEASPAQWVRGHPYLATSAAAAIGFIAAQIPGRVSPRAASATAAPPAPPATSAAPVQSAIHADLLALLVNLAGRFLQSAPESPPASLSIADAGAIAGPAFPRPFPAPAGHPAGKEPAGTKQAE